MTTNISLADLDWCRETAEALIASDNNVDEINPYPRVNRGLASWSYNGREPPETRVKGYYYPVTAHIQIDLPAALAVSAWRQRQKDVNVAEGFKDYVAAAVLHELIHARQSSPAASSTTEAPDTPEGRMAYYEISDELEAHAGQIAYFLLDTATATEADVLATPVGCWIERKLEGLAEDHQSRHAALRTQLTAAVNTWLSHFTQLATTDE